MIKHYFILLLQFSGVYLPVMAFAEGGTESGDTHEEAAEVATEGEEDVQDTEDLHASKEPAAGSSHAEEHPRQAKSRSFKGYAKWKMDFHSLCEELVLDGRFDQLFRIIEANNQKDPNCKACKPLFYTFHGACKSHVKKAKPAPKKKPKPVEEGEEEVLEPEATPTPLPKKQREPNLAALEIASRIFSDIAEDEASLNEHLAAVKKLTDALLSPQDKTAAEKEYFAILAEYISAPFGEDLKKIKPAHAADKKKELSPEEKSKKLDALFEH